jgi:hypothetical protein
MTRRNQARHQLLSNRSRRTSTNTLIINSLTENHLHPQRQDSNPGCDAASTRHDLPDGDHRLLHREIVVSQLELRRRADEAIALIERAALVHAIEPGELPLGSDNGSTSTARRFKGEARRARHPHGRGGYRDTERQASSRAGSGNSSNARCG